VSPARAAVLWNVLIEGVRQVGSAIDVAPIEIVGEVFFGQVGVGKRRRVGFFDFVAFENLIEREIGKMSRMKGKNDETMITGYRLQATAYSLQPSQAFIHFSVFATQHDR
jgi:hypothetical protein